MPDTLNIVFTLKNKSILFLLFKLKEGISKLNQVDINIYRNIYLPTWIFPQERGLEIRRM